MFATTCQNVLGKHVRGKSSLCDVTEVTDDAPRLVTTPPAGCLFHPSRPVHARDSAKYLFGHGSKSRVFQLEAVDTGSHTLFSGGPLPFWVFDCAPVGGKKSRLENGRDVRSRRGAELRSQHVPGAAIEAVFPTCASLSGTRQSCRDLRVIWLTGTECMQGVMVGP